ncbi:MAG: EAL and modified HD-GYP domain-containing signal transduction protein [Psychrosphaera sp.]|jgi:EAL and modified HD-GYP domain-containing signal transduction protein
MSAYVARQPILNINEETIGFELLFRDSLNNSFPHIDPNEATSKIITQNQLILGLEQICQNKLAFVNFHELSLLNKTPTALNKDTTIIEILEDVTVTDDLVAVCKELFEEGYKLALDDHDFNEKWEVLYPYTEIIKVDISQLNIIQISKFSRKLKATYPNIILLGERVETEHQLRMLKELGFTLFQGFFYAQPEMVEQTGLSTDKIKLLKLISLMANAEVTFDQVASIIEKEASISFALLRYISSTAFAAGKDVTTVKHALTYLGFEEIKKFVALIALANLGAHTNPELHNMAILRSKFCEFLEDLNNENGPVPRAYLTGLLSLISPIINIPIESIVPKLPIDKTMKIALLHRKGSLGLYLMICEAYEIGDWDVIASTAAKLGLDKDDIGRVYHEALLWQNEYLLKDKRERKKSK